MQSSTLTLFIRYGKFATNPNVTSKIPTLKDGMVKLVRGPDEEVDPVYTAAGVFITSHARDLTIRSAQANYDAFAYADTDSLHLMMDSTRVYGMKPEDVTAEMLGLDLEIHPHKLGAWKFEYAFDRAFYIRPKAYMEHLPMTERDCDDPECDVKHDFVTRIAGLPQAVTATMDFDSLKHGAVIHGKLNPRTVPGGVVLKNVPFELKLR